MRLLHWLWTAAFATAATLAAPSAIAGGAAGIEREAKAALDRLYARYPSAKSLAKDAKAILVFPKITKAGFMIGGEHGEGVLFSGRKVAGHYETGGLSYGLQAGAQNYGYALFFMTDGALQYLRKSDGWEIGVGPSVVVMDDGMASKTTTTTARSEIYAFVFGQKGLMAGLGIQGSKISKVAR